MRPDAALHLVENEQRAGSSQRWRKAARNSWPMSNAPRDALHRLDDDGRGVLGDVLGDVGDVAALDEAHVERRARQAVPLLRRAPGECAAPRPCGRESCAPRAATCVPPGCILNASFKRVLVGLRAGVDEEHAVEAAARRTSAAVSPRARARPSARHCVWKLQLRAPARASACDPARVAVAQRGDRVAAIQIEHLAAAAACAATRRRRRRTSMRILREHRRQVIRSEPTAGSRRSDVRSSCACFRSSRLRAP